MTRFKEWLLSHKRIVAGLALLVGLGVAAKLHAAGLGGSAGGCCGSGCCPWCPFCP